MRHRATIRGRNDTEVVVKALTSPKGMVYVRAGSLNRGETAFSYLTIKQVSRLIFMLTAVKGAAAMAQLEVIAKRSQAKQTPADRRRRCDCCSKPIRGEHVTDDEICQGGDGPGFFLCQRLQCQKQYEGKPSHFRRRLYYQGRQRNERASNAVDP